jgi:hypothetical protein
MNILHDKWPCCRRAAEQRDELAAAALTDARLKIRVDNGDALTSSSHFEPHRPSRLPWRPSQNYPMATPSTLVEKIVGSV